MKLLNKCCFVLSVVNAYPLNVLSQASEKESAETDATPAANVEDY